jgi:hypothetical protein
MSDLRTLLPALLLASALPAQSPPPDKIDFHQHVWPILEQNCVQCHRPAYTDENGRLKRPKGGLVLDSRKGIEAGRKGRPVVVAGKPSESELFQLVTLPADHEDRMPPADDKDPLSQEQIETLRRWIEQGAAFGAWVGNADGAPAGPDNGDGTTAASKPDVFASLARGLAAPDPAAIQKAAGKGRIEPVAPDSPLLRVSFPSQADTVTDADVQALLPLREHVAVLQLGRTSVGDGAAAAIARMPRLVRLDLRETGITDAGLGRLGTLAELRELNLFGTKVGDASVPVLHRLPKLQEIWVWRSALTAEAVMQLRDKRPGLKVNVAPDLPEPDATPPRDRPRRGR